MVAYEDLLKDSSESFEDNNYFIVTIEELEPGSIYPLQFRWKYKDGSYGKDWSATYTLVTESEQVPGAPGVTANGDTPGMITITWDGENVQGANIEEKIKQVDIYISGSPFDGSKPAINFDKAGTKTVTAPAGVYTIVAYAITARGTVSTQTTIANVTVTGIEPPVDPPTLPDGLSVASAPFAVSVNWNGTYASGNFEGFKSIDIHVRGSDVGSTATSGFSTTTQVATLTVNSTTNRQNVGLDNLRQARGLSTNDAAYTAPMFFYYIARNANDQLYSVGGTPTYTRINSSSVNPTKANFIDLESGVISIENLVAGNGQFSSWLRTGTAGGARIELSGVDNFTNSGNTVKKGLVAYSTGSTEVFNLDIAAGTLTINGSGTFTGDLSAGTGNSIFKSDSSGIYLGNSVFASAPFSVSRSGVIKAESGTIGGLTLASNAISNSAGTFKIGSTGQLLLGSESTGQKNLLITSSQIVHRTGSTATGNFTLDIATGTLTIGGYATTGDLATTNSAVATKIGAADVNSNVTSISGGVITTGTINLSNVKINNVATGARIEIDSTGLKAYKLVGGTATNTVSIGSDGEASFTGTITANSGSFTGTVTSSNATITGGSLSLSGTYTDLGGTVRTKTTSITSSTGVISITDTGTDLLSGGGLSISASGGSASYGGNSISFTRGTGTSAILADSTNITLKSGAASTVTITADDGQNRAAYPIYLNGHVSILNAAYVGSSSSDETNLADGAHMSSGRLVLRRNGLTPLFLHRTESTSATVRAATFYIGGVSAGGINMSTSNPAQFVTPSDYRLKENIQDYINASEVIKKARLRKFNFKNNPLKEIVGFVAHEYAEADSDFVIGEKDAVDEEGNPVYQEIMMGAITPYLIGALKESILKIEQLEARLDALEG